MPDTMATESASSEQNEPTATGLGSRLGGFGEVAGLVTPTVAWFVVFLLAPLVVILYYSFLTYSSFNVINEFTLAAWLSVFEPTIYDVFVRSLLIGVAVTAVTLVFGYPLAYYLRFYTTQNGGILLLLFLVIPFWTSAVVRTIGWYPILGRTGIINQLLVQVGLIGGPLDGMTAGP